MSMQRLAHVAHNSPAALRARYDGPARFERVDVGVCGLSVRGVWGMGVGVGQLLWAHGHARASDVLCRKIKKQPKKLRNPYAYVYTAL